MPICSFCKKRYEIPRGLTLILNDGRQLHFCGSKCRKNQALGRDSKKVNWVRRNKKGEIVEEISEESVAEEEQASSDVPSDEGKKKDKKPAKDKKSEKAEEKSK